MIKFIQKSRFNAPIPISGGSATAFSAFKVSVKNGLFLGQMKLSGSEQS
jgi:hypothetical protein